MSCLIAVKLQAAVPGGGYPPPQWPMAAATPAQQQQWQQWEQWQQQYAQWQAQYGEKVSSSFTWLTFLFYVAICFDGKQKA